MQRIQRTLMLLLVAGMAVGSAGCRNRMGDGGDGGGNGNDNGNDNGGSLDELTAGQKEAIDDVFAQMEAAARAFAGLIQGFGGDAEPQGLVQVGQCPTVTGETIDGSVVVSVDFGDGCTNEYFEQLAASGGITLDFGIASRSLGVEYDDFTVDGQTTSGSLDLQITRQDASRTLTGNVDIATTGVGSVSGSVEMAIDLAAGVITLNDASWTVADGDTYSVEIDGIVIAPIDNGNFVPEAGTVSFDYPSETPASDAVTITIEFDANSPVDGTVDVTIGGKTIEYDLPDV